MGTEYLSKTTPPTRSDVEVAPITSYAAYYARLAELIPKAGDGDHIFIVGWEVTTDVPIGSPRRKLEEWLKEAVKAKVTVRLLVPKVGGPRGAFNAKAVKAVNDMGGRAFLDDQVQDDVGIHQKAIYITEGEGENKTSHLFLGGMDLTINRESFWFDCQVEVTGKGAELGRLTLEERWNSVSGDPIPGVPPPTKSSGNTTVQFVRTYGKQGNAPSDAKRFHKYAPQGDFSYHHLALDAIKQGKKTIYIEDQYFVATKPMKNLVPVEKAIAEAMAANAKLTLLVVAARSEHCEGVWCAWRRRAEIIDAITGGLKDKSRFNMFVFKDKWSPSLMQDFWQNYVHTKTWVIDGDFALVGSANFNRSAFSNECEFGAGIVGSNAKGAIADALQRELWLRLLNAPKPDAVPDDERKVFAAANVADMATAIASFDDPKSPLERYDPKGGTDKTAEDDPDRS